MYKAAPDALISIVVPCHNESANIDPFYAELTAVLNSLENKYEIIFVDDGSSDDTSAKVAALMAQDKRVQLVELVRNFGKEIAVTAGLNAAKGDAAITLDADLQHPPSLIPKLIMTWREGMEVVVGLRLENKSYAPTFKRWGSVIFYAIMKRVSDTEIRRGATDYRLLDRSVVDEFNRFTERNRITRGLIDWLGFRRAYVEFEPAKRVYGEAAYSYFKLIKLALNSFIAMSLLPLRIAGYLGGIITLLSGLLGAFILVENYILNDPLHFHFSGPAILGVVILFMVGVILVCLGLIALYIGTIHTEVMNRPLYVVRRQRRGRPELHDNISLSEQATGKRG